MSPPAHSNAATNAIAIVVLVAVAIAVTTPSADAISPAVRTVDGVVVHPPPRPAVFQSVMEFKEYLNKLNEYYQVIGRPRFGKRAGTADAWPLTDRNNMAAPVVDLENRLLRRGEHLVKRKSL